MAGALLVARPHVAGFVNEVTSRGSVTFCGQRVTKAAPKGVIISGSTPQPFRLFTTLSGSVSGVLGSVPEGASCYRGFT